LIARTIGCAAAFVYAADVMHAAQQKRSTGDDTRFDF
jgi:hypothetical protein